MKTLRIFSFLLITIFSTLVNATPSIGTYSGIWSSDIVDPASFSSDTVPTPSGNYLILLQDASTSKMVGIAVYPELSSGFVMYGNVDASGTSINLSSASTQIPSAEAKTLAMTLNTGNLTTKYTGKLVNYKTGVTTNLAGSQSLSYVGNSNDGIWQVNQVNGKKNQYLVVSTIKEKDLTVTKLVNITLPPDSDTPAIIKVVSGEIVPINDSPVSNVFISTDPITKETIKLQFEANDTTTAIYYDCTNKSCNKIVTQFSVTRVSSLTPTLPTQ